MSPLHDGDGDGSAKTLEDCFKADRRLVARIVDTIVGGRYLTEADPARLVRFALAIADRSKHFLGEFPQLMPIIESGVPTRLLTGPSYDGRHLNDVLRESIRMHFRRNDGDVELATTLLIECREKTTVAAEKEKFSKQLQAVNALSRVIHPGVVHSAGYPPGFLDELEKAWRSR